VTLSGQIEASLVSSGYWIVEHFLESAELPALVAAAEDVLSDDSRRAGARGLTSKHPTFARLATDARVRSLVARALGGTPQLVRSILFDKNPRANWDVVWHQDTTIPVRERLEVPGFGPWSVKDGVVHVQPPADVLERMITVRIHLDECGVDNGALQMVAGSHTRGIMQESEIDAASCERDCQSCAVPAGGVLLMKPLILHASKKASAPKHRRIVHLEFASRALPGGLQWAEC
jgi:ectoine hydroxylase-related dioxygenase (phytanoyl-CoA dioxygenase family)